MKIGKPRRVHRVEPIRSPIPSKAPDPVPAPEPRPAPATPRTMSPM